MEGDVGVSSPGIIEGFPNDTEAYLDEVVFEEGVSTIAISIACEPGESGFLGFVITINGYEYYVEYTLTLVG